MPSIASLRRAPDAERAAFMRDAADDIATRIRNRQVSAGQARELAAGLRFQASLVLPERMDVYDRIYQARFERLIAQFLAERGPE